MDEIEEFLRKAAARRNRPQQQRPPQQEIEFVNPAEVVQPQPVQPPQQTRRLQPTIESRHIDTTEFETRTADMGEHERMVDERTDARLHQKFDHKISDLSGASMEVSSAYDDQDETPYVDEESESKRPPALNIASMFRSPANIQQAIILNEILQRPVHRW